MKPEVSLNFPSVATGCTCGPYWSVVPPPPCPHHTFRVTHPSPASPKELAALYRRLADALDPPNEGRE